MDMNGPVTIHACDLATSCGKVLTSLPEEQRSLCVFEEMEDRLPKTLREILKTLEPAPSASYEQRLRCRQLEKTLILDYFAGSEFDAKATAPCKIHNTLCPVYQHMTTLKDRADKKGLSISFASHVCIDDSKMGLMQKSIGKSNRSLWIYVGERDHTHTNTSEINLAKSKSNIFGQAKHVIAKGRTLLSIFALLHFAGP